MVQGSAKKGKASGASGGSKRKAEGRTMKGKRVIPPKDKQRVAEKAQQKKLSSSINNSIEKQMIQAASAGKLTIMRNSGPTEDSKKNKSKSK